MTTLYCFNCGEKYSVLNQKCSLFSKVYCVPMSDVEIALLEPSVTFDFNDVSGDIPTDEPQFMRNL